MHHLHAALLVAAGLAGLGAIALVVIRLFTRWRPWHPVTFRIALAVTFLLWLSHYVWARDWYSRPYSGWPGLHLFDAASITLALLCGLVAARFAPRRPLLAALAPLPLGFYWFATYRLLLWRPPSVDLTITDLWPEFVLAGEMIAMVAFLLAYAWVGQTSQGHRHPRVAVV